MNGVEVAWRGFEAVVVWTDLREDDYFGDICCIIFSYFLWELQLYEYSRQVLRMGFHLDSNCLIRDQ